MFRRVSYRPPSRRDFVIRSFFAAVASIVASNASLGSLALAEDEKTHEFDKGLTVKKRGAAGYLLTYAADVMPDKATIELYLAYKASVIALREKAQSFRIVPPKAAQGGLARPKADPTARRYSYQLKYWLPRWRFVTNGTSHSWDAYSGIPFKEVAGDASKLQRVEVVVEIALLNARNNGVDYLQFDPWALRDHVRPQVFPPTPM